MKQLADKYHLTEIYLPALGCANGHLSYEDVKPIISNVLDERFTCVSQFAEIEEELLR